GSSAYGFERAVEGFVVDHNELLHTVVAQAAEAGQEMGAGVVVDDDDAQPAGLTHGRTTRPCAGALPRAGSAAPNPEGAGRGRCRAGAGSGRRPARARARSPKTS